MRPHWPSARVVFASCLTKSEMVVGCGQFNSSVARKGSSVNSTDWGEQRGCDILNNREVILLPACTRPLISFGGRFRYAIIRSNRTIRVVARIENQTKNITWRWCEVAIWEIHLIDFYCVLKLNIMNPPKKKRNNLIIKLREKNKLSFNYIARIVGIDVRNVYDIYRRETANRAVDNSAK